MHALMSLIVTFLAIAGVLWTLGAPFAAALQVVVYAGAIMVLFVFVAMILNLGHEARLLERTWLSRAIWVLPVILAVVLVAQFVIVLATKVSAPAGIVVTPKVVGTSLFSTYLVGVELASLLLLAALVTAFHFGAHFGGTEVDDEHHTD
jgi:NADH-quinone oxidoreductase subunit J